MFAPSDRYVWDFWLCEAPDGYHLFFLQAPRHLAATERHDHATIGHAVSPDLVRWTDLGTALTPGDVGAWDDLALWTGSVVRRGSQYYLFYTGRDRLTRTQRIGLAVSEDLRRWEKIPHPVLEADRRWYVTGDDVPANQQAWRDPFVVEEPEGETYYAFVTARDRRAEPGYQGCVGLATSKDLLHWTVQPPAVSPGWYRDMEVPSVHRIGSRWILLFSVQHDSYHPAHPDAAHPTGVRYVEGPSLTGPYASSGGDRVLIADGGYAARLIHQPGQDPVILSWRMGPADGWPKAEHPYAIDDPRPLLVTSEGGLLVLPSR